MNLYGYYDRWDLRDRLFNKSVVVAPYALDNMTNVFDHIFSNIGSYKDEIASAKLYPFYIKYPDDTPLGTTDNNILTVLQTSHGKDQNIMATYIDPKATIMNIASIYVPHTFNNFLDYNGYCKYSLFLPFFSTVDLDASLVVGNYLIIRLSVDFNTGQGMYILSVSENAPSQSFLENHYYNIGDDTNERFLSNYVFEIGIDIPIGSSNVSDITRNLLMGAIKTTATVAAAAYGMALPPPTSVTTYEDVAVASARGDYKGARMIPRSSTESRGTKTTTHHAPKNKLQPIAQTVASGVSVLNNNFIQGHGDRPNNPMIMWSYSKIPYLIIRVPNVDNVTEQYKHTKGQPLGITCKLNQVSGYTTISDIHLDGINSATYDELTRIEYILSEGVILPETNVINFTVDGHSYSCPNGWTWEQFVRTNPKQFRMGNPQGNLVRYKYSNAYDWKLVDGEDGAVVFDELIIPNYAYTT